MTAINLVDYSRKGQYVEIRHHPNIGTPLKNKHSAERQVNLNDELCEVLNDYIRVNRHDITDKSGRLPLFTTMTRRLSRTTIRKSMNAMTRPCHVDDYCPHDREIPECEATRFKNAASCPSSVSPHALRRSAITYHLNRDWPKEKVSERANVSVDVLDEHYDARTEQERRSTRKQYLENL